MLTTLSQYPTVISSSTFKKGKNNSIGQTCSGGGVGVLLAESTAGPEDLINEQSQKMVYFSPLLLPLFSSSFFSLSIGILTILWFQALYKECPIVRSLLGTWE